MPRLVRASEGRGFRFGRTNLFVGPGPASTDKRPILAVQREGDKKPRIVGAFNSASTAALFIEMMNLGIEEIPTTTVSEPES